MQAAVRYLIGAAVAALLVSGARAQDWTATDRALLGAALVLHAADWSQTLRIIDTPGMYETNPVLGRHPSRGDVNAWFFGVGLTVSLLAYALPDYRRQILGTWVTVGLFYVAHNAGIGVRIGF
ncbi:MAG: hypothetical protein RJA99_4245 [Pseudomonadota bacterium]|jgi:hypothetical protein